MPAHDERSAPSAVSATQSVAAGDTGIVEPLWYNDWRQVAVPTLAAFTPELPVSVIVPYYARPLELARTLAALEGQTYPRELFEVVVVDDGSPEPLARPRKTPLDVRVVRQEDRGYGLARARNTGVRAAAHDVLLFLDADMLAEADWLAAHARWHHAVPDAVTLGLCAHVPMDGMDAGTIRKRPGTLEELFQQRKVELSDDVSRFQYHLIETDDLTSKADNVFELAMGGNYGIRRELYELVGGFDESFTQWGGEDTEFNYRVWTRGGLLVPVRDACAWRQGPWQEGREEKERSRELQRAKLGHLIAHPKFRTGLTGRTFAVPQYVVTIEGGYLPAARLLATVEQVLSGSMHDLVVRLELPGDYADRTDRAEPEEPVAPMGRADRTGRAECADHEGRTGLAGRTEPANRAERTDRTDHESRASRVDHADRKWLERQLGPDPRVRVAPSRPALEEFPASPFHVTLPAGRRLHKDVVRRLRAELGTAVIGRAVLADGSRASIVRAWALHRALRTPWEAADFGDAVAIPPGKLQEAARHRAPPTAWANLLAGLRQVDGPAAAWRFVRWFGGAMLRRAPGFLRAAPQPTAGGGAKPATAATGSPTTGAARQRASAAEAGAEYPLGVEIAALGARSRAVFAASGRVAHTTAGRHIDVVLADTAAEASAAGTPRAADPVAETAGTGTAETAASVAEAHAAAPVVLLDEAPPMLSVPAFDPRTDNPIGWRPHAGMDAGSDAGRDFRRDAAGNAMVGALGPLDRLPPGCGANCVVRRDDRAALREMHRLEDVAAFHADTVTRAGELARLAATGVVVHLADADRRLEPYLGAELFELMMRDMRDLDVDGREALGVRMRRAALRDHSLTSRARQVAQRVLADPPRPPLVSILLATRRPQLLEQVLTTVRRQTWPRLELILCLHGEGFGETAAQMAAAAMAAPPGAAGRSTPVTVLELDAALPLGSVLNAATQAARGTLLAKMDDDDLYGPDHILDLVLAHEYSQAPLVGKGAEFFYLAASDRTLRRFSRGGERFDPTIAGAALLIERRMLDRVGGWKRYTLAEDQALVQAVLRAGAPVYRTHPYNFLVIRQGRRTWAVSDAFLLAQADVDAAGCQPEMAGIADALLTRREEGRSNAGGDSPRPAIRPRSVGASG